MASSALDRTRLVLTTFVIVIFAYFAFKYRENLYLLRHITPTQIAGLFLLSFLTIAINGSKLGRILKTFTITLTPKEWFGLSAISLTLNSLFFKAGSLAVSNHLKRRHDFPYMSFVGALGADQLISLFINALLGAGVAFYLTLHTSGDLKALALSFLFLAIALGSMMFGKFKIHPGTGKFREALTRALTSLKFIFQNKSLLAQLCLHSFALIIVIALRLYISCDVLGFDIPFTHCLIFTTAMTFVRALPLLQSDLGTRELALGFLSEILGTGLASGMLAAFVDRMVILFWCLIASAGFRHILLDPPENKKPSL